MGRTIPTKQMVQKIKWKLEYDDRNLNHITASFDGSGIPTSYSEDVEDVFLSTKSIYEFEQYINELGVPNKRVLLQWQNEFYTKEVRVWPPKTIGNPLGMDSSLWYWEIQMKSVEWSKRLKGMDVRGDAVGEMVQNAHQMLDEEWRKYIWDKPKSVDKKWYGVSAVVAEVLDTNPIEALKAKWNPEWNRSLVIGGFVLLWVWMMVNFLVN